MEETISKLRADDTSFSMEGASWTNDLSWVEGYANVLAPMNQLSAQFHALFDRSVAADPTTTGTRAYQKRCCMCCCWKPVVFATGVKEPGPTMPRRSIAGRGAAESENGNDSNQLRDALQSVTFV